MGSLTTLQIVVIILTAIILIIAVAVITICLLAYYGRKLQAIEKVEQPGPGSGSGAAEDPEALKNEAPLYIVYVTAKKQLVYEDDDIKAVVIGVQNYKERAPWFKGVFLDKDPETGHILFTPGKVIKKKRE